MTAWGGYSESGNADSNIININGGIINNIIGGSSSKGHANYNKIYVYSGTANNITGGAGYQVKSNEIEIQDGTISRIYGGVGSLGKDGNTAEVKDNKIKILGGEITGDVSAGVIGYVYKPASDVGSVVSDNIINISNEPTLTNATLRGFDNIYGATHSGNALNIHTTGLTAKNIANFDVINFYLPSNIDTTTPVLTLTDLSTDISGAQVLAGVEGNTNLNVGDTVTLLTNNGTITDTGTTYGKLTEGVSLEYDLTVKKDGDNKIIATIGSASPTPTTPATPTEPETPIIPTVPTTPSTPVLNPKTDILTKFTMPILPPPELPDDIIDFDSEGLDSFFEDIETDWTIFAKAGAGPMRYKVNNGHIDTTNQNIDLSFARNIGNTAGKMTIAPIIDYQNTNYDSYLNDGTHARGNSKYTGGGFILRNLYRSGLYYETSFRMGRNKTDFASEDLDTTGNFGTITYDTSQTVWNAHLKLGKYIRLNKNNLLNVYGFYYHTHQGGSSADLSSGEHYNFSSANAGRLRIGYRMTTRTSKISQVYTGLAYQFEHNGGVTARYKDYSTGGENHKGSSGMLELGWIIKPLRDNPWTVDINATGWIGNQRGVKAFAKIQKAF